MSMELSTLKANRLNDSLFSPELAPHYLKLAGQLTNSELVPKSFRGKPHDLFLCWAMGYSIGMSPEQAMQCIAVINGRACMWGDEMLALCMAHKDFEDIIEEPILNKDGTLIGYTCTVKRKGKSEKSNVFTLDMAKKAGLLGKQGVWTQYPERMLKLRARGYTLRDACPDILKGIKSREEVEDYIEAEFTQVKESKGSRTEFIKQELLSRKELNHDESHSPVENHEASKETECHSQPSQMAETGKSETDIEIPNILINKAQKVHIDSLLEEKAFTEERLQKALDYYEVKSIDELTYDLAEDFIQRLNNA